MISLRWEKKAVAAAAAEKIESWEPLKDEFNDRKV